MGERMQIQDIYIGGSGRDERPSHTLETIAIQSIFEKNFC